MVWNHPTIADLATFLAGRMSLPLGDTAARDTREPGDAPRDTPRGGEAALDLLAQIENLSEDQVARLLAQELSDDA